MYPFSLAFVIIPLLVFTFYFAPKNVEAAIFYQNNFDSEITGTLPAGWSNIGSGTWVVGTASPVNSTKGLEDPVFHQGVSAVYTGTSAIADSAVQISQVVHLDGSNNGAYAGLFLRSSADGQNGYLIAPIFSSNTLLIYKRVSGSFTQINNATSFGRTFTNNEIALLKAEVSGTIIRWKIWKSTEIEPTSWIENVTDSSISSAGYFGIYEGFNGSNNGSTISSVDNLYWGNVGMSPSLIPGTISLLSQTSTTASLSSTAATGGVSPYTYQWYRSTTSDFTPGPGNILNGQTSLTLSDTGLTPSSTYYYKLRTTDSNSVIVDSSQFPVSSSTITAPSASWNVTNDGTGHVVELTNTYAPGAIIGSPSAVTGPNGSGAALSFTSGKAVDLGQNFKFGSNDFTIATWLKTSDAPVWALAAFGEWSGGGDFIWGGAGPAGLKSNVSGSDGLHTVVASGLNDGNWHLVGLIRRGTTLYLSIDGVDYNTASIGSMATINPDNNLFINQLGSSGASYGGNVDIYELGVWKGVGLPATEMMYKYLNPDTLWTGAPATNYTFTGPTSGTTNSASANFTVTPDGIYTGTISLASTGAGTFSPTSLTWNNSAASQTFTYTATSTIGSPHTISVSSNPPIINSSGTINYSVTVGPTTVAINDAYLVRSPYNWYIAGSTSMLAINPGAYFKLGFTGTSVILKVNTATLNGLLAKEYPRIRYSIDGGATQDYQLLSGDTQISLASGLAEGTHNLTVWFLSSDLYNSDRWSGNTSLKITGLILDVNATTTAPTILPKRLIAFGDSETEGAAATGSYLNPLDLTNYSNYEDSTTAYIVGVATDLNAEYGQIAFGGQSWDASFRGVPALPDSWNYYYSTNSRLAGGLFTPAPDYLFVNLGTNGGVNASTLSSWLTSVRAAAGNACDIFVIVPFNRSGSANTTTGFNNYKTASGDANVFLIDLGSDGNTYSTTTPTYSNDGLHPNIAGHAQLRTLVSAAALSDIDETAPIISSVSATPSTTTASITWTTDEVASSIVNYGLTNSYGSSIAEADTSPRVTTHTMSIPSLVGCTTYHYRVRSNDASANLATGSDNTFTTTGCTGSASITDQTSSSITTASGGTVTLTSGSTGIELNIPSGATGTDAVYQIKSLDQASVFVASGIPSDLETVGNYAFDLKAFTGVDTSVSTFLEPIEITLTYQNSDISGIDEASLWIHRYDGSSWTALTGCVVNTTANTVTCTTSSFSVFSLFGTALVSSGSGGSSSGRGSSGGITYGCKDPIATNYNAFSRSNPALCKYATTPGTLGKPGVCATNQIISQNLKSGSRNGKYNSYTKAIVKEAKILQAHLNRLGFSSGKEDGILGPISDGAIKRMQTFLGTKADGYVGPLTRALLNNSCGERGLSN